MTPLQRADAAAREYPALTALLKSMDYSPRQRYARDLKKAVSSCGRPDEVQTVNLILDHVDVETLAHKVR